MFISEYHFSLKMNEHVEILKANRFKTSFILIFFFKYLKGFISKAYNWRYLPIRT